MVLWRMVLWCCGVWCYGAVAYAMVLWRMVLWCYGAVAYAKVLWRMLLQWCSVTGVGYAHLVQLCRRQSHRSVVLVLEREPDETVRWWGRIVPRTSALLAES
jgi:hypothetical protein